MRLRWVAIPLAAAALAGCASPRTKADLSATQLGGLPCRPGRASIAHHQAEVSGVLARFQLEHAFDYLALERLAPDEADARIDALRRDQGAEQTRLLTPLAQRGNSEAMMRLAEEVRNGDAPADIRRWLGLVGCAADLGHPRALDEMVRWHWHQRGDGSVAFVQASRAQALGFAGRSADAGNLYAISRIGTYIAGNVHQYPANLALAGEVARLCARADDDICQEELALGAPYDYLEPPERIHLWLSRLAARHPERFAARRDQAWARLTPDQQAAANRAEADWRPTPWSELRPAWDDLARRILAGGAGSLGPDAACTTATPWCRGALAGAADRR